MNKGVPFGHDGWVIVGVDEICMIGKPTHAEDGDHATKHLHNLKKGNENERRKAGEERVKYEKTESFRTIWVKWPFFEANNTV